MGATSGHVSMWCSMMDGYKPSILVYDQAKMSQNYWKSALEEATSSEEQDAPSMISSKNFAMNEILCFNGKLVKP